MNRELSRNGCVATAGQAKSRKSWGDALQKRNLTQKLHHSSKSFLLS
jgi:hypothetical protein